MLQNRRRGGGGQVKFYPYKKKSFSHAGGGGGTESFGVVLTRELDVLTILKGAHPLKGRGEKLYPVLRGEGGGGAKSFGLAIFLFCSPTSPSP